MAQRACRGRRLNSVEPLGDVVLGDWWAFGERKGYGERKRVVESQDWEGPSYQTCADAAWVARRIETSDRSEVLPWTTHRAIAAIEDPAERRELLARAADEGWTVRETKAEVARRKNAAAIGAPVAGDDTCTVADLWKLVERGRRLSGPDDGAPWSWVATRVCHHPCG